MPVGLLAQDWKRILKETSGIRAFIFRQRLQLRADVCGTGRGLISKSERRKSVSWDMWARLCARNEFKDSHAGLAVAATVAAAAVPFIYRIFLRN